MYGQISLVSSTGGVGAAALLCSGATGALELAVAGSTLLFAGLALGKLVPKRRSARRG